MAGVLFLIAFSLVVAVVLITFISVHDRKMKQKSSHDPKWMTHSSTGERLDIRQFSKICMDLCEILKLEIINVVQPSADEFVAQAESPHPITRVEFLICGFLLPQDATLDPNRVQEISEQIISERISKGIIITTGKIDLGQMHFSEQAPLEFIDGIRLQSLIAEHKLG